MAIWQNILISSVVVVAGILLFVWLSDEPSDTLGETTDRTTLQVYFPIRPKSVSQFAYTEGVERQTTRSDQAVFIVEQLIAGPTAAEQEVGFYSAISFTGEPICEGDFYLEIDNITKSARLQFCRQLQYRNNGDTERVRASLARSLTELPEIASLIYLDSTN